MTLQKSRERQSCPRVLSHPLPPPLFGAGQRSPHPVPTVLLHHRGRAKGTHMVGSLSEMWALLHFARVCVSAHPETRLCVHMYACSDSEPQASRWLCTACSYRAQSQRQKDPEFSQGLARTLPYPSILLPLFGSAKKGVTQGSICLSPHLHANQPSQPVTRGFSTLGGRAWGDRCPGPTWLPASSGACHLPGVPTIHLPLWGPYRPSGWSPAPCHRSSGGQ